jgi:hypothetical protein
MFSKFFPNAEEMSAYTFKQIQSDSDDDDLFDVEDIYNFEELVLCFFICSGFHFPSAYEPSEASFEEELL